MGYNVTDEPAFHASSQHSQQQRGAGKGNFPLGSWEAFLLEGHGHFHHSPPGQPLSLRLCDTWSCSTGDREQLNVLSEPFLPGKLHHSGHLSWQDMASTAKEDTGQSSSAASGGSWSQPPQAGPPEAVEESQCPICLGHMKVPACVTYCMHKFCLRCIWLWSRERDSCPVCRQPIEQMLFSVEGDHNYKECSIGLGALLKRRVARDGASPGMLQVMEALDDPWHLHGRRRPVHIERARRPRAAPRPSNARSQQAPTASHDMAPLREDQGPAAPAAPLEPQSGTE